MIAFSCAQLLAERAGVGSRLENLDGRRSPCFDHPSSWPDPPSDQDIPSRSIVAGRWQCAPYRHAQRRRKPAPGGPLPRRFDLRAPLPAPVASAQPGAWSSWFPLRSPHSIRAMPLAIRGSTRDRGIDTIPDTRACDDILGSFRGRAVLSDALEVPMLSGDDE